MCGNGGLRDNDGNEIVDVKKLKNQNWELKPEGAGVWTLRFSTIEEYVNWAKTQKSLIEEMLES